MWIQYADISYVAKLSLLPVIYEKDTDITYYSCPPFKFQGKEIIMAGWDF